MDFWGIDIVFSYQNFAGTDAMYELKILRLLCLMSGHKWIFGALTLCFHIYENQRV